MLVPQDKKKLVINCRLLSFFMPGLSEQYMTEAIKRQFNVEVNDQTLGSALLDLDSSKLRIDTSWQGTGSNHITLGFSHSCSKYVGDAKGDVTFPAYDFKIQMRELQPGILEIEGISFNDGAVGIFNEIEDGFDPNRQNLVDQLVYAMALSSISYTKGAPKRMEELTIFLREGLGSSLVELSEVVRRSDGLQYSDAFFEEIDEQDVRSPIEGVTPNGLLLSAIDKIANNFAVSKGLETISQLEFVTVSQNRAQSTFVRIGSPKAEAALRDIPGPKPPENKQ
ncbi:MAG: hypothetical protein AAF549_00680 [Pseudomonadota bacterium]